MKAAEETNVMDIIKSLRLTRDDVIVEAETVRDYGEWQYIQLMGYSYETLIQAASEME